MKTTLLNLKSFEQDKEKFLRWGDTIKVRRSGGSREIFLKCNDGAFKKVNTRYIAMGKRKEGMHICWMVSREIENRIKSGEYVLREYSERYNPPTVFYNSENIKKHLHKEVIALDITSCYYTTAFVVGAIGQRVYDLGNKKDREWKEARNTSIGSLGKKIWWDIHTPGQPVESVPEPNRLRAARLHIMEAVAETAKDVFTECFPGWLMFLTDCFFLLPEQVPIAKRVLAEYGYNKTTEKKVIFTGIRPLGLVVDEVSWEDVPTEQEKKSRKKKKKAQESVPVGMRSKITSDYEHYHFFNSNKNQFIV